MDNDNPTIEAGATAGTHRKGGATMNAVRVTRVRCSLGALLWNDIDTACDLLEKRLALETYFWHINGIPGEIEPCQKCGKAMIEREAEE